MNKLELTIIGQPVPQARPRVTSKGTYTPKKSKAHELVVRSQAEREVDLRGIPAPYTDQPVKLEVDFFFPVPGSWPAWKRRKAHAGSLKVSSRPDLDNLVKLVKDALNGVAYEDDSQIVEIAAVKHYAYDECGPFTDIVVKELSDG